MLRKSIFSALALACVLAGGFFMSQQPGEAAGNGRVFELRTYYTHPGKLPNLLARFRNHTTKLFEKHGMTNIGYWVPQDAPGKDNTLIYVLAHRSRDAAMASWKAFQEDAEWKRVCEESEKGGKIVEKVDRVFMEAVDFSKIK